MTEEEQRLATYFDAISRLKEAALTDDTKTLLAWFVDFQQSLHTRAIQAACAELGKVQDESREALKIARTFDERSEAEQQLRLVGKCIMRVAALHNGRT